jgi:hypothetical protein
MHGNRSSRCWAAPSPHAAIPLAAAAWGVAQEASGALGDWVASLGPDVELGPVPDQAGADAWVRSHTLDLIDKFPLAVSSVALVLVNALATKISWARPFELVPSSALRLPRASGFVGTDNLLIDGGEHTGSVRLIAATDHGLVAVHAAHSTDDDLVVVSVIADPSVPPESVIALAHPIAMAIARNEAVPGATSLFELALGAGHSWTIEEPGKAGVDPETVIATLPAWSADARIDLIKDPDLGFRAVVSALCEAVHGACAEAVQAAVARYTRTGFEAAAVTAIAVQVSARARTTTRQRTAALEFTHPYAVTAVARDSKGGRWAGLPVFSAWVTRADQPPDP